MLVCKIGLLLVLIPTLVYAQDYTPEHTLQCTNINNEWSLEQNLSYLWNVILLHKIDQYFFLVGCPLTLIMQVIIIATFVRFKLYRSPPLDIIFGLFIWEMMMNISLLCNAIFHTIFSDSEAMPCSFPTFCMVMAFIAAIFGGQQQIYLLYFLIHVIMSVKKSIKHDGFEGITKHVISIIVSVLGSVTVWAMNWLGLSQMGICTVTTDRNSYTKYYFPVLQAAFSIVFVCFSFVTYRYFKKHMPEGEALNKRKYQQNQLINRFAIGMSIILALLSIAVLALFFNCFSNTPQPLVMIAATVFNLTRVIGFIYMIVVMLTYKKIGNKAKKLFRSAISRHNAANAMDINRRRMTITQIHEVRDFGIKQKILDIQEEQNQIDFMAVAQIMTMLAGISIAYKEYFNMEQKLPVIKNLYFYEEMAFQVEPKLVREYQHDAFALPRLSLLKGKFTIYAPRIFNELIVRDRVEEIAGSFDLVKNFDQIYKISEKQQNGGKSGQFFFFTSDNRFIIKTIDKTQFKIMLEELREFYEHFALYPHTYIAKIYGMFSIHNKEINRQYYILLMKNISGCPRNQITRIYDMKGSTHDRQILRQSEEQFLAPNGVVLKDLDFVKLEHRVEIDHGHSKQMRQQLQLDTAFLKDLNIIDYSLLLMRVSWPQPTISPQFWGKLQRLPSTVDPNEYYHISLIDYLQKWDLKKKGEKWWKNLFGKKDTSAQQPSLYQSRFMKFIREITECDSNRGTQTDVASSIRQTEMAQVDTVRQAKRQTVNIGNVKHELNYRRARFTKNI